MATTGLDKKHIKKAVRRIEEAIASEEVETPWVIAGQTVFPTTSFDEYIKAVRRLAQVMTLGPSWGSFFREVDWLDPDDIAQQAVLRLLDRVGRGHSVPRSPGYASLFIKQEMVDTYRNVRAQKRFPGTRVLQFSELTNPAGYRKKQRAREDKGKAQDVVWEQNAHKPPWKDQYPDLSLEDRWVLADDAVDLRSRGSFDEQVAVFLDDLWPGRGEELVENVVKTAGYGNGFYRPLYYFQEHKILEPVEWELLDEHGNIVIEYGEKKYLLNAGTLE